MLEIYAYVRHGFVTKSKNKVFAGLFETWHRLLTRLHLQTFGRRWAAACSSGMVVPRHVV